MFFLTLNLYSTEKNREAKLVQEIEISSTNKIFTYRMANGLHVFITENKKAPAASIYHWVKAGSLHEKKGITGIAHLFEHMMFRPVVIGEEGFWQKVQRLGAMANANTRFYATLYTSTVPKENVKKMLKIEAERFQKLSVTKELLKVEKEAVRSEYKTKFDSNPMIDMWFQIYHQGFQNHPYGWTIIGDREDLDRITFEDCNEFYKKYYGPQNTGLFISGDLSHQEVMGWVGEYYQNWMPGSVTEMPKNYLPVKNKKNKYEVFKASRIPSQSKNLLIGFYIPEFDVESVPTILLSQHILFGSEFSLVNRDLVIDKRWASEISDFNFEYDSGLLKVMATLSNSTVAKEKFLDELFQSVQKINKLNDDEWKAYINEFQISLRERLLKNETAIELLSLAWGKYGSIEKILELKEGKHAWEREKILAFVKKIYSPENMMVVENEVMKGKK